MSLPSQVHDAWYVMANGVQYGPLSASDLQRLAREGRVSPTDLVFTQGWQNWFPAAQVPGLFSPADPRGASTPGSSVATRKRHGGGGTWAFTLGALCLVLLVVALYVVVGRTKPVPTASFEAETTGPSKVDGQNAKKNPDEPPHARPKVAEVTLGQSANKAEVLTREAVARKLKREGNPTPSSIDIDAVLKSWDFLNAVTDDPKVIQEAVVSQEEVWYLDGCRGTQKEVLARESRNGWYWLLSAAGEVESLCEKSVFEDASYISTLQFRIRGFEKSDFPAELEHLRGVVLGSGLITQEEAERVYDKVKLPNSKHTMRFTCENGLPTRTTELSTTQPFMSMTKREVLELDRANDQWRITYDESFSGNSVAKDPARWRKDGFLVENDTALKRSAAVGRAYRIRR